jgi:flagellar basal body-associated protein FliL
MDNALTIGTVIIVFLLVVIGILFSLVIKEPEKDKKQKYPRGHWIGMGISYGVGPGEVVTVCTGALIEYTNKGDIREATAEERKIRKVAIIIALVMLALGLIAFGYSLASLI